MASDNLLFIMFIFDDCVLTVWPHGLDIRYEVDRWWVPCNRWDAEYCEWLKFVGANFCKLTKTKKLFMGCKIHRHIILLLKVYWKLHFVGIFSHSLYQLMPNHFSCLCIATFSLFYTNNKFWKCLFLVTGSRDSKLALWRVDAESCDKNLSSHNIQVPDYATKKPEVSKACEKAQKVRALSYHEDRKVSSIRTNSQCLQQARKNGVEQFTKYLPKLILYLAWLPLELHQVFKNLLSPYCQYETKKNCKI